MADLKSLGGPKLDADLLDELQEFINMKRAKSFEEKPPDELPEAAAPDLDDLEAELSADEEPPEDLAAASDLDDEEDTFSKQAKALKALKRKG